MSDTTERDAVRAEFYARHHHGFRTLAAVRAAVRDAMADEIASLRAENAALTAERDRTERILAALREPSLALLFAGQQAYAIKIGEIYADEGHVARHHQTLAIDSAIRAAVAAAEQEVGRE